MHLDNADICHAARDGDCDWANCPQNRDGEPGKTGRSCPLIWLDEDDLPALPIPTVGADGKIVGGVYNGMTKAEVAASRASFPHEG